MKLVSHSLLFACLMATPAVSQDGGFPVLPGMDVGARWADWERLCARQLVLTDYEDEENYLTCILSDGDAATGNVSPGGIVWWAGYQDASGQPFEGFLERVMAELGLDAPGAECTIFDDPALCWSVGTLDVVLDTEPRADRWIVSMEDRTIFDPDAAQ